MTTTFPGRSPADLPYSPGTILTDTQAHVRKLEEAWRHIRRRYDAGLPLHNATGLERGLALPGDLEPWMHDDEWAGALYADPVRELGLAHLGGSPGRDDILVTNRLTAALFAAAQVTVRPGATVIGVSPSYSHPAVVRAVRDAGGRLVQTIGAAAFEEALAAHADVPVVFLTRLAVTYDALPEDELRRVIELAHARGALVIIDDAGGARVGPAVLGQPRTLELGADLGATGLDKYGVTGPRVGLLGGRADLVAKARARAFELGSECRPMLYPAVARCLREYRPERVRELVASTHRVGQALRARLGDWIEETPFITRLPGEGVLTELSRRSGGGQVGLAPIEATALLAMTLLADHGLLTVHFAGLPPGTAALLIKFLPPETITAVGGPEVFAAAVDEALHQAATIATDLEAARRFLHGPPR
ncbi:MAG: aminotransferase class I/II-fold pyridoxal phosphate-dependent enzyme [Actinomadura sp.]